MKSDYKNIKKYNINTVPVPVTTLAPRYSTTTKIPVTTLAP